MILKNLLKFCTKIEFWIGCLLILLLSNLYLLFLKSIDGLPSTEIQLQIIEDTFIKKNTLNSDTLTENDKQKITKNNILPIESIENINNQHYCVIVKQKQYNFGNQGCLFSKHVQIKCGISSFKGLDSVILLLSIVFVLLLIVSSTNKLKTVSLAEIIQDIKEQIFNAQQKASSKSENAMFVLGNIKINLKTVIKEEAESKITQVPIELSSAISNENTQDITIELDPIEVFSGKQGQITIYQKQNNYLPPQRRTEHITIAHFTTVGNKKYLFFKSVRGKSEWIDVESIIKLEVSNS
jgi:hypothetical protein